MVKRQMKIIKRKLHSDNAGMTLIELLVAIVLLSIIIIPLLHSFVSTANVNRKAKIQLRATTVAQNLMESMNALSLEDIAKNMYDENSTVFSKTRMSGHGELGETPSYDVTNNVFREHTNHQYEFYLDGVIEDGQTYDARVLIDASGYRDETDAMYTDRLYNKGLSADIANYNSKRDVLVIQPDTENQSVAVIFLNNTGDVNKTVEDIQEQMSRKIVARIYDGDTEGTTEVKVTATFHCYDAALDETNNEYVKNYGIYTFREENPLRNLFIGYVPNYDSKSSNRIDGQYLDQIEIDNQNNSEVVVSVIKQLSYTTIYHSDALIFNAEKNYRMQLTLKEALDGVPDMNSEDKEDLSHISIRTNLGTNLGSNLTVDSTEADRLLALCPNQTVYRSEYTLPGGGTGVETDTGKIEKYYSVRNIEGESGEKNAIYQITVSVYPAGGHAAGYPEDDRIVTLSNS